jgi:hypothetical protein
LADITRWGLAAAPALAALRVRGHMIAVFGVGPRAWLEDLAGSYRELVETSAPPRTPACASLIPAAAGT